MVCSFLKIGIGIGIVYVVLWRIGIGIGIVYVLFWELVLVLELFIQWLKNWYWYWNCLYYVWRIGIGTGIVYTMTEELVLVLELFTQWPKNWYWCWNCLHNDWRLGIGIVYTVFEELVLHWNWLCMAWRIKNSHPVLTLNSPITYSSTIASQWVEECWWRYETYENLGLYLNIFISFKW